MLKVIIADDEINICKMIQKLVDWDAKGLEVVATANNAVDAYRYIEMYRPDIVISDIRMPGYDGLELIQRTIDGGMKIDFVIISGYKYFEYAHKALKLGVEHFILKPIDKKELEDALNKIIDGKEAQIEKQSQEEKMREELYQNRQKIRRHYLTSIINQEDLAKQTGFSDVEEDIQNSFHAECFQAFLVKIDEHEIGLEENDYTNLLHIIGKIVENKLKASSIEYVNSTMKSSIVSVINYNVEQSSKIEEILNEIYHDVRHELDKFHVFTVTIGVGKVMHQIGQVQEAIRGAIGAIKCRLKTGTNRIIYADKIKYQEYPIETFYGEKEKREITNMTEALDFYNILLVLDDLFAKVREKTFYSPTIIYEVVEKVVDNILSVLKENNTADEITEELDAEIEKILDSCVEEEQIQLRVKTTCMQYFNMIRQNVENQNQLPIRQAKQYIKDHYNESISLEYVAEAIHLSPSYLSTLFKKEIGINFSEYMIQCRMDAAKKLLKTTTDSIADVAEAVGYSDSKYFSKTFTKSVGIKPSVYRKLYS